MDAVVLHSNSKADIRFVYFSHFELRFPLLWMLIAHQFIIQPITLIYSRDEFNTTTYTQHTSNIMLTHPLLNISIAHFQNKSWSLATDSARHFSFSSFGKLLKMQIVCTKCTHSNSSKMCRRSEISLWMPCILLEYK